jgi:hypothetical protein
MKKPYIIGILAIILAAVVVFGFFRKEPDPEIVSDPQVELYVKENISALSPIKEQLGGTFYVTNMTLENGEGTVEYEDGHNAYTADFNYGLSSTGQIEILNFNPRQL